VLLQMTIKEDKGYGLDRLINFSDAVIAIAITLLVLDIRLPEAARGLDASIVSREILALWPKYLGYLVSFWVIGLYWMAHHRIFHMIRSYDRRLLTLNLIFLSTVAFMPFPTSVLFDYAGIFIVVLLYAGTLTLTGLSLVAIWLYATHKHRLVDPQLDAAVIRSQTKGLLAGPAVFLLSIVVAIFDPNIAMYIWLLQIPAYFLTRPSFAVGQAPGDPPAPS
jgi:TMEM175 potassium channel family protein